uniref:Uncharacterized protein n=1 Tax=Arundo donax TaxID=35708 RepID=A0A0A8Z5G9_ARUDO
MSLLFSTSHIQIHQTHSYLSSGPHCRSRYVFVHLFFSSCDVVTPIFSMQTVSCFAISTSNVISPGPRHGH